MALIYGIINLNAFIFHSDSVFNETVTLIIVEKPKLFLQWYSHVPADHHMLLATVLKKKKKNSPQHHRAESLHARFGLNVCVVHVL